MKRLFACFAAVAFVLGIAVAPVVHAQSMAAAESTSMQSTPPAASTPGTTSETTHETMKSETPKTQTHKAHAVKKAIPKLDINSASKEELEKLPGITEDIAEKIVQGRPYKTKGELLTKKLVPRAVYTKIRGRVMAKQEAAATTK